ncbi:MAG: dCMP deaminase family protein [Firmicutes bacterium]|nr:dCMP deaminase family protein [Bacillota bacterium]
MNKRPSWDEYFMQLAFLASTRSTCLSRKVGAVIEKEHQVISMGYNGPACGVSHCEDKGGCERKKKTDYKSGAYLELCLASHAEQNAIAQAAKHGISTSGSTIYVTTFPCKDCMNSIVNSGIKKIVFEGDYNASLSKQIALEAKIELINYVREKV